MRFQNSSCRRGITLLEVLIALGILAVGLTSVLTFIPAGHSMAQKAVIADHAAIVAANAAADLATQGFLHPDGLSASTSPVLIDPIGIDPISNKNNLWPAAAGLTLAVAMNQGVYSSPTAVPAPAARTHPTRLFLMRSRDDVAYNVPSNDLQDVTNAFVDGLRTYTGRFSYAAMLATAPGVTLIPGDTATLTVLVFHNRDTNAGTPVKMDYTPAASFLEWPPGTTLVAGRTNKDVIRTNAIFLATPPGSLPFFRRATMAAIDEANTGALIAFEGAPITAATPMYVVPDAVAVFEKIVSLETSGPYRQ